MLRGLSERGIPVAILSNKPHDFTLLTVARLLPDLPFAEVVGARQGVPKKPDPTAALGIARRLGVAPGAVAYLGDTNTNMQTAVAAGFLPVGVRWGFREAEELSKSGARVLIARPGDLLALFDSGTASGSGSPGRGTSPAPAPPGSGGRRD